MKPIFKLITLCIISISASTNAQIVQSGLKAHFDFENNVLDISGNNEHLAVVNGTAIYNQRDSNSQALFVDGLSTISSINSFNNSNYTQSAVSIWIKTVNVSNSIQTCLQGAYMGFGAYLEASTGKFMGFFDASTSGAAKSANAINDGSWHHIVMQNNGTTTSLYVDGILNGSITDYLSVGNGGFNNRFYIGKTNLSANVFKGAIDDLRIYNRTLTQLEIDSLYNKHLVVSTFENSTTKTSKVDIFPNPTSDQITIDFNQAYTTIEVEITDLLGKSIAKKSLTNNLMTNMELIGEPGIYLVRMVLDGKVVTHKVIKQ